MKTVLRRLLPFAALAAVLALPAALAYAAGNWVRVSVPYSSFSTDGGTKAVTIYKIPAGQKSVVEKVIQQVDKTFAGAGVASATVSVGKSGEADRYVPATNVLTGASTGYSNATLSTGPAIESGGTAITATLTVALDDGGVVNTSVLDAGKMTFLIEVAATPPGN